LKINLAKETKKNTTEKFFLAYVRWQFNLIRMEQLILIGLHFNIMHLTSYTPLALDEKVKALELNGCINRLLRCPFL